MKELTKKLTQNDYRILTKMYESGACSKICAKTINKIAQEVNLSTYKVRESMKIFLILNFVEEGVRCSNAKSYFLTDVGQKEASDTVAELQEQAKRTLGHNGKNGGNK